MVTGCGYHGDRIVAMVIGCGYHGKRGVNYQKKGLLDELSRVERRLVVEGEL